MSARSLALGLAAVGALLASPGQEEPLYPPAAGELLVDAYYPGGLANAGSASTPEALGTSLWDLAQQYADLTGQILSIDEESAAELRSRRVGFHEPLAVPAEAVQGFFEALLEANRCTLTPLREREPRVAAIVSLEGPRRRDVREERAIDAAELARLAGHPAAVVQVALELEHLAAPLVSQSLRPLVRNSATDRIVGVGPSTVLLQGRPSAVATWTRTVLTADREYGSYLARQPAGAPGSAAGGD